MDENCIKEALGKICWLEIPVKDIYRAQKFYTDIFSWDCDPEPKDPVQYPTSSSDTVDSPIQSLHFFRKGEALNGAFMLGKADHQVVNYDPNRPRALPLLPTIHIEDCADTLRKAEALGGKTTWPKTEIGRGMGFFARPIDTEGNMLGVWSHK